MKSLNTHNLRPAGIRVSPTIIGTFITFAIPKSSDAHVKWFSPTSFADKPNGFSEILTPTFFWLAILSMTVIALMVLLEQWLDHKPWMQKLDRWLSSKSGRNVDIMRLGMGATLLWAWQAGTLLTPELKVDTEWIFWLEFLTAFLLIFPKTIPLSGVGVILLYFLGIWKVGFFYMLDYMLFPGIGYFFIVSQAKGKGVRQTALPAVYATVGFCLIWLGIEKLVYPSWALLLLDNHPILTLGLDHRFFLMGAAFVEISLGFMIMVCLQQRLLALTITLVFFLTTLVFGRQEIVGHTLIHAVLVVFLIAGAGTATPPIEWLPGRKFRAPGAAIGFALFLGALMFPYVYGAKLRHETLMTQRSGSSEAIAHRLAHSTLLEVGNNPVDPPELGIAIHKDPVSGWNLELITENFEFDPQAAGSAPVSGKGHAHLYINGVKKARIYSNWFHIESLPKGKNEIEVTLNANNHATLTVDGIPVSAVTEIEALPGKQGKGK